MSTPHPIIQSVLDAHFPGIAKAPVMECEDAANQRIAAIVADRNALLAECEALRAENAELRARLEKQ